MVTLFGKINLMVFIVLAMIALFNKKTTQRRQ